MTDALGCRLASQLLRRRQRPNIEVGVGVYPNQPLIHRT